MLLTWKKFSVWITGTKLGIFGEVSDFTQFQKLGSGKSKNSKKTQNDVKN